MDEQQAKHVADALGGEPCSSGGGIEPVLFRRSEGKLVVLSGDILCEYENDEAFNAGQALNSIVLH